MCGAAHDVWAVNTDFEYHEEQRVTPPTLTPAGPAPAVPSIGPARRPAAAAA
jgi:hypothetical protein